MTRKLSVFDLDHTLISVNSSFQFSCFLLQEKVLSPWLFFLSAFYYFRYHFFGLPITELHKRTFEHVLKGLSPTVLSDYVSRFVRECLPAFVYMPALSQLRLAQQLGERTAIFSSAPDFLVEAIARLFHVDEWRATSYLFDASHCFSGISYIVDGQKKRAFLDELRSRFRLDVSEIAVYSDSYLDLPFLLGASSAIAVKPDKKLRAYANAHNWPII